MREVVSGEHEVSVLGFPILSFLSRDPSPDLEILLSMVILLTGNENAIGKGDSCKEVLVMAFEVKPWKGFSELTTLREEMDKMWNRFFGGEWPSLETFRGEWAPSVDVSETKDSVVVRAEVPGLEPKDIDISLSNDVLTIRGKKEQEKEEKEENYHRIERSYGSFSRSIRLPREVQGNKIKANYKNGVLRITLPKSKEAKEIKIKVE